MEIVLAWTWSAYHTPGLEFLICADSMDEVRAMIREFDLYWMPDRKNDRLSKKSADYQLALSHKGDLLWRPAGESDWQVGAQGAADWLDNDAARFNATQAAARERRKER